MVEEASASGTSLASEAEKLRQLVAKFELASTRHLCIAGRPQLASNATKPLTSPARRMLAKVAGAIGDLASRNWAGF